MKSMDQILTPPNRRVNPVTLSFNHLLKMEYQLMSLFELYLRKIFFKTKVLKLNPK